MQLRHTAYTVTLMLATTYEYDLRTVDLGVSAYRAREPKLLSCTTLRKLTVLFEIYIQRRVRRELVRFTAGNIGTRLTLIAVCIESATPTEAKTKGLRRPMASRYRNIALCMRRRAGSALFVEQIQAHGVTTLLLTIVMLLRRLEGCFVTPVTQL
jgi:hypothetical protein